MSKTLLAILDLEVAWKRLKLDITINRVFIKHPWEVQLIELDLPSWLEPIVELIGAGHYHPGPITICDIPKGKGLVRPGNYIPLVDRIVYIACVGALFPQIHKTLLWSQGVLDFSYQLAAEPNSLEWLRNRFKGWQGFREKSLALISKNARHVVIADIAGFYENIDIPTLISDLKHIEGPLEAINQVRICLERWAQIPGRGIPQGNSASDILAKLYLDSIDQNLAAMGYKHLRYVDDIRIFCRDKAEANKALLDLSKLLRKRGLILQSAKTKIHPAGEARAIIEGIQPILNQIREKYIKEITKLIDMSDPYLSIFEAEEMLAECDPDEAPIELIREAYRVYFINSPDNKFDKTFFRFLLRRLGKQKDKFAVDHCKLLIERHPEETDDILDYFKAIDAVAEVEGSLIAFLRSPDAIYPYQTYLIIDWVSKNANQPSTGILEVARKITFDSSEPSYLKAVCRKLLGDFGTKGDLERLEHSYCEVAHYLEQCEIICSLKRMETSRRNAFLKRAEGDGKLNGYAVKWVKNIGK